METRDLLVLIGLLRGGTMFPLAVPLRGLPAKRSLRLLYETIADQERHVRAAMGAPAGDMVPRLESGPTLDAPLSTSHDELRERAAVTDWSGDYLAWTRTIGEVPDPGVVLCLLYDGPAADAALPIDVFAQTLRRYALRDPAMRARFDAHVDQHGTFVPPWLSPEVREQRSREAFERAMKAAHEQGFAAAAPLFEGVRGPLYAEAQIALAAHEARELGDTDGALGRLDEVLRVAPRNVAARVHRAQILMGDASRRVEAAADWFAVLRETGEGSPDASPELVASARQGLWALHAEFANTRKLEAAAALLEQEPERGFEAVSRYVHTHPCAWDAHLLLASLSLARQGFELAARLLRDLRWLYPDDANPHFVYGQALAAKGNVDEALPALEMAARLAPGDRAIAHWLEFARGKRPRAGQGAAFVKVAHHVARTLFVLVGFVREGKVLPAALSLRRVPGDVSLALVVQALAAQERRRFRSPDAPPLSSDPARDEVTLRSVGERAVLLDDAGDPLHPEQLVGDVRDPGVVIALLYERVPRDPVGRPSYVPSPAECRRALARAAETDSDLAAKLERHRASPEATLLARLELG